MATEIIAGPLGERRGATTAGGGTALSTTATFVQSPPWTAHIQALFRNFSQTAIGKLALNPWLVVLKTTDNMTSEPFDYSVAAQDASTSTDVDVSALSTLANGDFLLVGSHIPFRGVYIDVDASNGAGTATLSVYYYADTWTNASATDGTFSTMTFAQDGLVYWTVPTTWQAKRLIDLYPSIPPRYYTHTPLFWTRWSVSAALTDTSITFNSMVAANRSTSYAEYLPYEVLEEVINHGFGGVGCIEALVSAGTANLIVRAFTRSGGKFVS